MADDLDIEIGRRLRQARIAQGKTQKEVSQALSLSHQAYQKYESGSSRLSVSTLAKLQIVLKLPLVDLLPTIRSNGSAIGSPSAAIGRSITGVRLAKVFDRLTVDQQRTLLEVAKAMQPSSQEAA